MIRRVLKSKLVGLGYGAGFTDKKTREFAFTVDASQYTEGELIPRVEIITYNEPTADIARYYLNINENFQDRFVFDGKLDSVPKFSSFGSQINVVDYKLSEKLCFIGITKDCKIKIIFYNPSNDVVTRYGGMTYEEVFGEDRESEATDYIGALTAGGRITALKAKDIIYVLLSEYIIDIIMLENFTPIIRICENAKKFADAITNYEYKYINRRINRIEYVEKEVETRYVGLGVKIGRVSNDPYLTLNEVNSYPDFPVNRTTYTWIFDEEKGQDVLLLYVPNEKYPKATYRELLEYKQDPALRQEIDRLTVRFSQEAGYAISKQYIQNVIKKLNKELLVVPMDFIRRNTNEQPEYIEPLRYKFTVMRNRKEFESILYNSLENNINGRYKFRFVEKLSGIYVTIGNKLNYTDINNKIVRKQSVADFNINFNAAIIKRETIIDERSIPQLLGYIYKDIETIGTDMLPVPSIEVVFFFPELSCIGKDVEMYNGTSVDEAKGDGFTSFYDIGSGASSPVTVTRPKDPNEKYITIRYVNSDGESLKENIIRDLPIGSMYAPEIIPIITDREGREWIVDNNQTPNIVLTDDNSKNVLEIRYLKKIARVRINYINKLGTELSTPVIKNFQVGETFDLNAFRKFKDSTGTDWSLYLSKPSRFVVSDENEKNVLTLVYDVVKAEVFVSYKSRDGVDLKPQVKYTAVANQEFSPEVPNEIIDDNGCVWVVGTDSKTVIYIDESETNNIDLYYDPKKARVVVSYLDLENLRVKDDSVELIQVGKEFSPDFEQNYIDIFGKWWKFSYVDKPLIKVSEDENANVITARYEKINSTIYVSMLNERGQKLRDDLVEAAQIGTKYTPSAIQEIEDTAGFFWECVDKEKTLIVSESEVQNRVSYTYKPLITTVYFQYVDEEGNELLPQKSKEVQAGSIVTPEFISELVSKDQREWVLSPNNVREFMTKKYEEENIVKINYDRKLVDIFLSFVDISGNILKPVICVKAQLGSEYKCGEYDKITSDSGERWMVTRTEPQRMFVRENSRFTLVYDEIKAKVVVKCVNIADNKSIVDDILTITKLGGVFVPNIGQKILDRDKHRWKYVGEPAMSIITKENEQENIIYLKYEEDKANVTLQYINNINQKVHKDVVKAEQIGCEIAIKEYDKIIEESGMGWKLKDMSRRTIVVDENPDKNIVTSNYVPLLADVLTRYIDNDGKELMTNKTEKIQVGLNFNADILPKITDFDGKIWSYSDIKVEGIQVKDEVNKVNIKYIPLIRHVTLKYVDLKNNPLLDDKVIEIQAGSIFEPQPQIRAIDTEGKYWIFQKYSRDKIRVSEVDEENTINYIYDKELVDVVVQYYTDTDVMLLKDKSLRLQIGSIFDVNPPNVLEDQEKLSWIVPKDATLQYKIAEKKEDNIYKVVYERYMVHVYDKYINDATNDEVIKPKVSKFQVGSKYLRKVEETIVDEEGKHWLQAMHGDSRIFASSYKIDEIRVIADETRNVTVVKYKPKLVDVKVRFKNADGKDVKPEQTIRLQIGSIFKWDIPERITDGIGNKWVFDPDTDTNIRINEDPNENVIVLNYDEQKAKVTFRYLDKSENNIIPDTTFLVQIGNVYTPQFDAIITDDNECVWEYVERNVEHIEINDDDSKNIFDLVYIPLNVDVQINYLDLWDKEISEPEIIKAQLGSVYKPVINKDFINQDSLLFRLKSYSPQELKIRDLAIGSKTTPNVFNVKYEPIMSDLTIRYKDLNENLLRDEEKLNLQVGSKYNPEPPEFIRDKDGNEWHLINAKKDEITVFENPNENIINFSYEVAIGKVVTRYISMDGLVVKNENVEELQVGKEYVPKTEPYIFDSENKKWRLVDVKPVSLKVGSLDNIVTITYREALTKVTLLFVDQNGKEIKMEQKVDAQIGSKYSPKLMNKVLYNENEIWRLQKYDPFEIIVSENQNDNVVKLIYSNAKVEREDTKKKKEFINPFANTMTAEEMEEMKKMEERAAKKGITFKSVTPQPVADNTIVKEEPKVEEQPQVEPQPVADNTIVQEEPQVESQPVADNIVVQEQSKVEPQPVADNIVVHEEPKVEEQPVADNIVAQEEPQVEPQPVADNSVVQEEPKVEPQPVANNSVVQEEPKVEPQPVADNIVVHEEPQVEPQPVADNTIVQEEPQVEPQPVSDNIVVQEEPKVEPQPVADNIVVHEQHKFEEQPEPNNITSQEQTKAEEQLTGYTYKIKETSEPFEFTEQALKNLSNSIYLTNSEKIAINDLNMISDEVIAGLKKVKSAFESGQEEVDLSEFEEIIRKEKEIVRVGLGDMIATDKTGAKILKVFEAITASESGDKFFNRIQQKKSILIADYFVEKPVNDIDKALYICERGKNDEEFVIINQRMKAKGFKEFKDAYEIKTMLCYEKLMLDDYYKARTINNDKFFKDENARKEIGDNVASMVGEIFVSQAESIFKKDNLTLAQITEVEAIVHLCTPNQLQAIKNRINQLDGKAKRNANSILRDIERRK